VISFVGAGPGAADLITLRGRDRLAAADVVVWASSLVPEALLDHAPPTAEIHDSAGMTLEDVLAVFTAHPDARIVRLHSGDPVIYGAIQEQVDWCVAHERDFEIVPGVSSLGAAAAAVQRELTIPTVAQSVVLTRLGGRTAASMPERESVAAFAAHGTTMAVFLSAARPVELQRELLAAGSGYSADTPAAVSAANKNALTIRSPLSSSESGRDNYRRSGTASRRPRPNCSSRFAGLYRCGLAACHRASKHGFHPVRSRTDCRRGRSPSRPSFPRTSRNRTA